MTTTQTEGTFEGWCILEIMGHRKLGGYLKEVSIAGSSFIRFDSFKAEGEVAATQFYNPSSIYCITPTTEEIAIAYGLRHQPSPVQRWELHLTTERQAIAAGDFEDDHQDDEFTDY